ncbi:hypothetical protein N7539_006349 [Penicillium diatomitis]|uniref:Uncharacterized protein n=1 Tax=Penicillium diatomitis TaxID=2819901 RepID=A0A9X0BSS5_9EURO|nr:uncharacterized protein N7539_006349 [Penicillium diatomitis]KAJ5482903.1 hypothetical protein N7539_006349 [Penicillium diatomitis]
MASSARSQAEAQEHEGARDSNQKHKEPESHYWSGIQPRYMSVEQEQESQYDIGDMSKSEMLNRNRLLRSKPHDPNDYAEGPVEG